MERVKTQPLMFRLLSNQAKAFLVVADSEGNGVRATTMRQVWPGIWETPFTLQPGKYRGRFYVGDESQITYHGPACPEPPGQTNRSDVDGMDGVFVISRELGNYARYCKVKEPRARRNTYASSGRWWA